MDDVIQATPPRGNVDAIPYAIFKVVPQQGKDVLHPFIVDHVQIIDDAFFQPIGKHILKSLISVVVLQYGMHRHLELDVNRIHQLFV